MLCRPCTPPISTRTQPILEFKTGPVRPARYYNGAILLHDRLGGKLTKQGTEIRSLYAGYPDVGAVTQCRLDSQRPVGRD